MASEKSFAHLWLSEGFATYMTNLYFEHQFGRESMVERLRKERREVISFARKSDHAVVDSTTDLMSLLNANSYQKGGWVLHMLRQEVGNSDFKKIIQAYYQKYKGSNAETRDFEAVAEQVTGKDLRWFFDQWLYRKGVPELEMEMKIDGDDLKIRIIQKKDLYRFPLEVQIVLKDGTTLTERIPVEGKETEFKMKTKGPASVTFDPETKLLFWYKDLD
jgi:aminopeptidase N